MAAPVYNIQLPADWHELTQHQLLLLFRLIAVGLSAAEAKCAAVIHLAGLRRMYRTKRGTVCASRNAGTVILSDTDLALCFRELAWVDDLPSRLVCLKKYKNYRALPSDFTGVPLETYITSDNYFQGYVATHDTALLGQLTAILYQSPHAADSPVLRTASLYWFASLRAHLARIYPNMFRPAGTDTSRLGQPSPQQQQALAVNSMLRALTGGDITREEAVLRCDTHRAFTEIDTQCRIAADQERNIR